MLPFGVMGSTMATYCGQNMGAGKQERIRSGIWQALLLNWGWSAGMVLLSYTIAPVLVHMVTGTDREQVLRTGALYLKFDTCTDPEDVMAKLSESDEKIRYGAMNWSIRDRFELWFRIPA